MRLIDADEILRNCNGGNCWCIPREAIEEAPTIDAEPVKHGEWKCMADCGVTECDQCGWSIEEYVGDYNFCPNCGARMIGGEDE